jgi:predicted ester cyclase
MAVSSTMAAEEAMLERNKRLVIEHFDDFVNKKDLGAIDRNTTADFHDHDGPGGKPIDRDGDRAMMARMHKLMPDLKVEVKDAIAEGDKVVVRNVWTGTNSDTGQRIEFHGFVLWRIADGKIAERWATVTPMCELVAATLEW